MVIDTSALLAVLLNEPERDAIIAATTGVVLFAPASLPWEIGNALVDTVRRRRLTRAEAQRVWAAFEGVPLRLVEVDIGRTVELAVEQGLYGYDAYMLELARSRRLPLLSLDTKLCTAAKSVAVDVVEI